MYQSPESHQRRREVSTALPVSPQDLGAAPESPTAAHEHTQPRRFIVEDLGPEVSSLTSREVQFHNELNRERSARELAETELRRLIEDSQQTVLRFVASLELEMAALRERVDRDMDAQALSISNASSKEASMRKELLEDFAHLMAPCEQRVEVLERQLRESGVLARVLPQVEAHDQQFSVPQMLQKRIVSSCVGTLEPSAFYGDVPNGDTTAVQKLMEVDEEFVRAGRVSSSPAKPPTPSKAPVTKSSSITAPVVKVSSALAMQLQSVRAASPRGVPLQQTGPAQESKDIRTAHSPAVRSRISRLSGVGVPFANATTGSLNAVPASYASSLPVSDHTAPCVGLPGPVRQSYPLTPRSVNLGSVNLHSGYMRPNVSPAFPFVFSAAKARASSAGPLGRSTSAQQDTPLPDIGTDTTPVIHLDHESNEWYGSLPLIKSLMPEGSASFQTQTPSRGSADECGVEARVSPSPTKAKAHSMKRTFSVPRSLFGV